MQGSCYGGLRQRHNSKAGLLTLTNALCAERHSRDPHDSWREMSFRVKTVILNFELRGCDSVDSHLSGIEVFARNSRTVESATSDVTLCQHSVCLVSVATRGSHRRIQTRLVIQRTAVMVVESNIRIRWNAWDPASRHKNRLVSLHQASIGCCFATCTQHLNTKLHNSGKTFVAERSLSGLFGGLGRAAELHTQVS